MDLTVVTRALAALNLRRKKLNENEKGFTLIELLVVVIIIGILAAIAIPVYLGVQDSAKDSATKSDLANVKIAYVSYMTDHPGATAATAAAAVVPTVPTTGALVLSADQIKYGVTFSANTTSLVLTTATGYTFCVVGTSKSSGAATFNVTDTKGVLKGSACGTDAS